MKTNATILLMFFISSIMFGGDIVTLNDQKSFDGKVKSIKNCVVKFKVNGETYFIPAYDIFSIEFENPNDKVLKAYLSLDDPDKCLKGQQDADLYHGKAGAHVAYGVLFGPFALIGAAVASPTPQTGSKTLMMSKNKDLFSDTTYLVCYKKKAIGKNVGNAALGWAAWVLFVLMI
jgi:hypothetical protein